ncbi:MAG: lmo0937 family membrane protein [Nitrososphaerales archaeon]
MVDLFWTVAIVLVVLWLFGLIGGIGGELINVLVVAAVVVVGYRLYEGKDVVTGR